MLLGAQAVISSLWSYLPAFTGNCFLGVGSYIVAKPLSEDEMRRIASEQGRTALIQLSVVLVATAMLL